MSCCQFWSDHPTQRPQHPPQGAAQAAAQGGRQRASPPAGAKGHDVVVVEVKRQFDTIDTVQHITGVTGGGVELWGEMRPHVHL